ncbi:PIG-X / PBN1 domain-containing protein [Ditylenchus destructor]|nr:PIG-X / PBN1 domain-containing protein [Ditylenchus destructor]
MANLLFWIGFINLIFPILPGFGEKCNLSGAAIDFKINGDGFHRTVDSIINITSKTRLMDCEATYVFHIPNGAYIDVDKINASLHHHYFIGERFDTEEPAWSPKVKRLQPIYFHSTRIMRKVFTFQDNLIFPIHLRYHVPIESEDGEQFNNIVEINAPRVYLTCEYNKTFIEEPSCRRNIEKIPCHSSLQGKCPYFRLESRAINSKVSVLVPVGNKDHTIIVTISTVFIVFGCVVYLIRNLLTAKSVCGSKCPDYLHLAPLNTCVVS